MIGKPPKGTAPPVHRKTPDRHTQGPDQPPRVDIDPLSMPYVKETPSPTLTGQHNTNPDVVLPIPPVRVSPIFPAVPGQAPPPPDRPLKDYWIPAGTMLPEADFQGIRMYRQRQFVALAAGRFVQVDVDAFTGLYRAKLSSERDPSGPLLLLDPDGKFWRPLGNDEGRTDAGPWGLQVESTLQWQAAQLFRRLGYSVARFSDVTVARILAVSGINERGLLDLHVDSRRPPALLEDTIRRFSLDLKIQTFILQMRNPDPAIYTKADPQLQLKLLQMHVREIPLRDGALMSNFVDSLDQVAFKVLQGEPVLDQASMPVDVDLKRLQASMGRWAQQDQVALFKSLEGAFESDCDENTLQMRRVFPELPKLIAQALWRNAGAAERLHMHNRSGLPQRMAQETLVALRETRLARAGEGIYLNTVSNPDSDRLALHMIGSLADWPPQVRIEIRRGALDGDILTAIGDARSPVRHVLIRQDAGYVITSTSSPALQGSNDLYSTVWFLLPPVHLEALGMTGGGGLALQQLIRAQPLPSRQVVSEVLGLLPLPFAIEAATTQYRQAGHLRGGADDQPALAKSFAERVRDLYPEITNEDVATFINERLRNDPSGVLIRLEKEFATLRQELKVWSSEAPPHPTEGMGWSPEALADQVLWRRKFSEDLQSLWQQQSLTPYDSGGESFSSFIDFTGELPRITARFEHVTELGLEARNPNVSLGNLLDSFPNLRYLILEKVRMEGFAPGIFQMRDLRHLILKDCSLRLSANDAEGLSRIETLTLLRLDANPLGVAPHVGFMRQLEELYLSDTGLTQIPSGVDQLGSLKRLDLHNNDIVDVGEELFEIPDTQNVYVNLIDNPLGDAALLRIDEYLQHASMDSEIIIRTQEPVFDDVIELEFSDSGVESEDD